MADRPRDVTILAPAGFLIAIAQLAIGIFMILFVGVTLDSSTIFTIGSVLLVVSGAARLFGYWGVWNLRRTGWELAEYDLVTAEHIEFPGLEKFLAHNL